MYLPIPNIPDLTLILSPPLLPLPIGLSSNEFDFEFDFVSFFNVGNGVMGFLDEAPVFGDAYETLTIGGSDSSTAIDEDFFDDDLVVFADDDDDGVDGLNLKLPPFSRVS